MGHGDQEFGIGIKAVGTMKNGGTLIGWLTGNGSGKYTGMIGPGNKVHAIAKETIRNYYSKPFYVLDIEIGAHVDMGGGCTFQRSSRLEWVTWDGGYGLTHDGIVKASKAYQVRD